MLLRPLRKLLTTQVRSLHTSQRPTSTPTSRQRVNNIGIVGAGIGGLTASVILGQRGYNVDLYEASTELRPALGAGYGLTISNLLTSEGFDIGEKLKNIGVRAKRIVLEKTDGSFIGEISLDDQIFWVMRDQMQNLLQSNLPPSSRLHLGHRVVALNNQPNGVEVEFEDGKRAFHDLVIGADGINGVVREIIFGDRNKEYAGMRTYYGVAKRGDVEDERVKHGSGTGYFTYSKSGFTALHFPCGDPDTYVYFIVTREPIVSPDSWEISSTVPQLLQILEKGNFPPYLSSLVRNTERVLHIGIYTNKILSKSWHSGNIVLLGDAAHATSPFLGQGANQAVLDAVSLYKNIEQYDKLEDALVNYHKKREPQTSSIIQMSSAIGTLETSTGFTQSLYLGTLKFLSKHGMLKELFTSTIRPVV